MNGFRFLLTKRASKTGMYIDISKFIRCGYAGQQVFSKDNASHTSFD